MPIDNQPIAGKSPGTDVGAPGIVTPPVPLKKPKKDEIKLEKPAKGKKLKDVVNIRPKVNMAEAKDGKHAVMTFGRMNPPTTGHEKLIHKTHQIAQKHGTKANIILSHSHDKKNNPLPQNHKINYVKKIHPGVNVSGSDKQSPSFLHHAKKLHQAGHDHLHVVAGSDRVGEYKKVLNKYNGHKDHYNFKSITVHSAGQRDPDSEGASGISGTKMRAHAKAGDHKSFKAGLPKSLHSQHKKIMSHIHEEMENAEWEELITDQLLDELVEETYKEESDILNERVMTLLQRRKAALKMRRLRFRIARARKLKKKRMASTDMLVRRARRAARTFIRKRIAGKQGGMYASLSPSQKIQIDKRVEQKSAFINKLAKRLLPKVKQAELKRLKSARSKKNESINLDFANYYAEISNGGKTSTDDRRTSIQEVEYNSGTAGPKAANARVQQLKDKHANEKDSTDTRHKIEKEKLKVQMAKSKQAELRREARDVSEAVDVMVDALSALSEKAVKANVDLDTLFIQFIEGYYNPHGQQTPQQGGFAKVNSLIAEMSTVEKDKAEDIVKGMKKKASYFRKRYGKDAKSVMYATANKLAQEQVDESLKDWFGKGKKGDWVRVGVDGKIKGDCAREEGEGKPKCMPRSKAHSMKSKDRASAARRKRAADPVADRSGKGGKPVMVKTDKVKEAFEGLIAEKSEPNNPKLWAAKKAAAKSKFDVYPSAYANGWAAKAYKKAGGTWRSESVEVQEGGEAGWARFNKKQGKKLRDALKKSRKQDKNKVDQFDRDDYSKPHDEPEAIKAEGMGAAYSPGAGEKGVPEREITSKAVMKQMNRNRSRDKMKGTTDDPSVRYVHRRQKETDLVKESYGAMKDAQAHAKKDGANYDRDVSVQHKYDAYHMKKRGYTHRVYGGYGSYSYNKHGAGNKITSADHHGISESIKEENTDKTKKLTQLFRMGLAKKGELHTMLRMIKRDEDALKDPKLRSKMYELLDSLTDIITKDNQIFVKVRQSIQKNKEDLQAVEEMLQLEGAVIGINKAFEMLNTNEDMSGMSVSSGHKRSVKQGAGMTAKGVNAYKRRNPGSKLKTAVTTPPSKLKPGSKAAGRRKAFCSRSRSWSSDRGKAARARWNC